MLIFFSDNSKFVDLVTLFFCWVLVEALWFANVFEPFDLLMHDTIIHRSVIEDRTSPVVLLVIDDDALNKYSWPIPDEQLAKAISILDEHGARAIGFDLYRDKPLPPGSNSFEKILTEHKSLVSLMRLGSNDVSPIAPPKVLRDKVGAFGSAAVPVDRDGVVRRKLLYTSNGNTTVPSFSLALALSYLQGDGISAVPSAKDPGTLMLGAAELPKLNSQTGPYRVVDTLGYQRMISYRSSVASIPRVTLSDLLERNVDVSIFKDKVVVIGTISQSISDRVKLPISSLDGKSLNSGVVLQALVVDEIISLAHGNSKPNKYVPHFWIHLMMVIICLVLAVVERCFKGVFWGVAATAVIVTLTLIVLGALIYNRIFLAVAPPLAVAIFGSISLGLIRFIQLKREQMALLGLFRSHVSPDVADAIWRERDHLNAKGGKLSQQLMTTVMFVDVSDSTIFADSMKPDAFASWIGEFHQLAGSIALRNHAFIDKFLGDGLMLVFGAPLPSLTTDQQSNDARRAILCARQIGTELACKNQMLSKRGLPEFRARIGIHTGVVFAATVGPSERLQYTVMGRTPAVAARLEALAKTISPVTEEHSGVRVLATSTTVKFTQTPEIFQSCGQHMLKGIESEVAVYALVDSTRD